MKQVLLSLAILMAAVFGTQAQTTKTYTDYLTVTINHQSTAPQAADVNVIVNGDKMDLTLKNFMLSDGENKIPVGNIAVTGMQLTPSVVGNFKTFERTETIMLEEGDPELSDFWLGTSLNELGGVPIVLKGQIDNEHLYVIIDIDMMSTLGQIIRVEVGTNLTAKTYTDDLTVTINGDSTEPQPATVMVTKNEDGTMGLTLKNFMLSDGENKIPVGNISVDSMALTPSTYGTYNTFERTNTIFLGSGDPELSDFWLATSLNDLGGVPIVLKGQINNDKLYVAIDIDMQSTLGQIIYVKVGEPWEEQAPVFYTITFAIDGKTISTLEVEEGAPVTAPEVEAREGYTFAWTDEVPAAATADVTINGTYTVNQYTITFVVDGQELSKSKLDFGTAITAPAVKEREGYTFAWSDEIPATMPNEDLTINGTYTVNQYLIKVMDVNTGDIIYEEQINYGAEVNLPTMEEREGYTFEWFGEAPDIMPAHEVTLQGTYTANHYTCTWILNGETYQEMSIPYGEVVPDVTVESDGRYTFTGWDNVPATMPAHDVTINGTLADGIAAVQGSTLRVQNAYNLAGQRVNAKNARGIVIVNGKKIVR